MKFRVLVFLWAWCSLEFICITAANLFESYQGQIILHLCNVKCCMQLWNFLLIIMYWFVVLCSAHTCGRHLTPASLRGRVPIANIVSQVSPDSPSAREGGKSLRVKKVSRIGNYREGNWSMTNGHKKRMIGRDEEMDRDVLGIHSIWLNNDTKFFYSRGTSSRGHQTCKRGGSGRSLCCRGPEFN